MNAQTGPLSALALVSCPGGTEFVVHVVPGARRERLVGPYGDALRVAVAAPPEKGRANEALVRLLAAALGKRPPELTIVSGERGRRKRVRVAGPSPEEVRARLELSLSRSSPR